MYKILALFNGIQIAFMILFNATLAEKTGLYFSLAIVNSLCFLGVSCILLVKKQSIKPLAKLPKFLYLAGIVGLLNITLNNISFVHLGATLCMGLTLYGQLLASLIIDFGGFFGLKKQEFHPKKLIGIVIMSLGILIMILF